jgi:hypothetical protein
MPRAPKLCGREGCIELVRGQTYCDLHAKERGWPRGTGSTRTNTASHRQRRLRILKRDNYRCQLQYSGVCTDVASVVDHRQALGLGGQDSDNAVFAGDGSRILYCGLYQQGCVSE